MANLIFALKGCRILVMVSDVPQDNLQLCHPIASGVGMNLPSLVGRRAFAAWGRPLGADFGVDLNLLTNYLQDV